MSANEKITERGLTVFELLNGLDQIVDKVLQIA
jgi:hypothetical protein